MRNYKEKQFIAQEQTAPLYCQCPSCGKESVVIMIDDGIGLTDYWGSSSVHRDYRKVTKCCEVEVE